MSQADYNRVSGALSRIAELEQRVEKLEIALADRAISKPGPKGWPKGKPRGKPQPAAPEPGLAPSVS